MTAERLRLRIEETLESVRPLGATTVELADAIVGPSHAQLVRVCKQLSKLEAGGQVVRSGKHKHTYWRKK